MSDHLRLTALETSYFCFQLPLASMYHWPGLSLEICFSPVMRATSATVVPVSVATSAYLAARLLLIS